jgi:hypothetical protein
MANRKWAVLVFMSADHLQLPAAHADIVEMQRVGSSDDVAVAIQIQLTPNAEFKRFELESLPSSSPDGELAKLRAEGIGHGSAIGDPQTLEDFLIWADKRFKANNYLLVLWGHSYGLGFGQLPTGQAKQADNLLHVTEIAKALHAFNQSRNARTGSQGKLEILGHNTCNTSKAEIAIELAGEVSFLVASQLAIPLFTGWPFQQVLETVVNRPEIRSQAFAEAIVERFAESYVPKTVALSALNLAEGATVRDLVARLADAILGAMSDPSAGEANSLQVATAFINARENTMKLMPKEAAEPAVDFYDLCQELIDNVEAPDVKVAAQKARTHRTEFVINNDGSGTRRGALRGFLVLTPGLIPQDQVDAGLRPWIEWSPSWQDTKWPKVVSKVSETIQELHRV